MKRENTKRLLCILQYNSSTMKKEQYLSQLLRFNTSPVVDKDLSVHYFIQLSRTKELILTPNKVSTRQKDTMIAKSPVLSFMSMWFFEFNQDSVLKLSDYALKIYQSNAASETVSDLHTTDTFQSS
jgi:hypothetical protein